MLSVRTDKKNIDFNNRRYLEHFKELCGPLVDVHSDDTLELVHATAKKLVLKSGMMFFRSRFQTGIWKTPAGVISIKPLLSIEWRSSVLPTLH